LRDITDDLLARDIIQESVSLSCACVVPVKEMAKFIKDLAIKDRSLHGLLRKSISFKFDENCKDAFTILKNKLTLYSVLRIYDSTAETERDTCAQGLSAILLQKQQDKTWSPIAYFSRSTNKAETRYHSFELEMLAIVKAVKRFQVYLYDMHYRNRENLR